MHANAKRTGRKASLRTYSFEATVQGRRLEIQRIVPENVWFQGQDPAPELVFLHEGLGSVAHWKKFPAKVAASTGCAALVYSRYGSGNSDLLKGPREVSYMHDEAIKSLPDLLKQLQVEAPILIGHSDGASIALIYAAVHDRVRGLVLLAPHLFVEDLSVKSIAEVKRKFETTNLPAKLSRYHRDADRTFWG
jgi:pimeloyl-ACP methyl ester carboxylesterase